MPTDIETKECPDCKGVGGGMVRLAPVAGFDGYVRCDTCEGKGRVAANEEKRDAD